MREERILGAKMPKCSSVRKRDKYLHTHARHRFIFPHSYSTVVEDPSENSGSGVFKDSVRGVDVALSARTFQLVV